MIHIRYFFLDTSAYRGNSRGYPSSLFTQPPRGGRIGYWASDTTRIRGNSHPAVWLLPVLYDP